MSEQPKTTHPAVAAALAVIAAMAHELEVWRSYGGPTMASEVALEHQIAGARKVLEAVVAACHE